MSFTNKIKNELLKTIHKNSCCEKAGLYATLLGLRFFNQTKEMYVDNLGFARYLSQLTAKLISVVTQVREHSKRDGYSFKLVDAWQRQDVLKFFNHVNLELISKPCCQKVFVKNLFLACGTISEPEKEYRIEFKFGAEDTANEILNMLNSFESIDLGLKLYKRKGSCSLYCKDSSKIEDILIFIGAKQGSMELMQTKMYKEVTNNFNRQSNFETANMDKTFSASARQMVAIAIIVDSIGIAKLEKNLSEIANIRIDNPKISLNEIAKMLGVSRSSVNYRLNKLIEISEKIKKGENL